MALAAGVLFIGGLLLTLLAATALNLERTERRRRRARHGKSEGGPP